jgi:hypothetical protein
MRRFTKIFIFQCHAGMFANVLLMPQMNIPLKIWAKHQPKWRCWRAIEREFTSNQGHPTCIFLVHVGHLQYFHWFSRHGCLKLLDSQDQSICGFSGLELSPISAISAGYNLCWQPQGWQIGISMLVQGDIPNLEVSCHLFPNLHSGIVIH